MGMSEFGVVFAIAIAGVLAVAYLILGSGTWKVASKGVRTVQERANERENRKKIGSAFFVAIFVFLVFATLPFATASPDDVIYVPDNYTTIQEAANTAYPGGTIIVRDDTYTENVNEQLTTTDLSAWHYNRTLYIKENSGKDLTDYQVLINLSGNNFPVEANESGADIRFVDETGAVLNYWIEEYNCSAKKAQIWVKVPEIPANETVALRMYWGNPGASAVSDGDATFEFFDDFSQGNLDKWDGSSQSYTFEDGIVRFSREVWNGPHGHAYKIFDNTQLTITIMQKSIPGKLDWWGDCTFCGPMYCRAPGTSIRYLDAGDTWLGTFYVGYNGGRTEESLNSCDDVHRFRIRYGDWYREEIKAPEEKPPGVSGESKLEVLLKGYRCLGGPAYEYVDWIFVRKYASSEPTISISNDGNQPPLASFACSPPNPRVNQPVTFDASSSYDPDGYITKYEWDFGDGNIKNTTEQIIVHFYPKNKTYKVILAVTDNNGSTNSTTKEITVGEPSGDWMYSKIASIKDNSGETLIDYQVLVNLSGNFPVGANHTGSDLRFVDADDKELSYWIEEFDAVNETGRIWVKVPVIPANETIFLKMYYGNPDASAVSDGNATFVFFDDFAGTTLNVSKWHKDAVNKIDYTINNYFRFEGATISGGYPHPYWIYDGTDTGSQHQAKWAPRNSFIVEWNSKISNINANEAGEGGVAVIAQDNTIIYYVAHMDPDGGIFDMRRCLTNEKGTSYCLNVNNGDEAKFSIAKDGNNYTAIINDIVVDNYTSSTSVSKIALTAGATSTSFPYLDYVQVNDLRVRKYTSSEPIATLSQELPCDYDLVAEWHFDEGSGNIVTDSSGNGNDGIKYGATWTTGVSEKALEFDGTDDYVEVQDSQSLDITDAITIEAWVKRTRFDNLDIILEKGGDWNYGETNYGMGLHSLSYNNMFYFFFKGGCHGVRGVSDFNWHHYAVVATNGATNPDMYIDGELKSIEYTEGATTMELFPSTRNLHIGAQVDPECSYYCANIIDEIVIYNRALTATEIKTHYEKIKPTEELSTKQKILFTSDRSGNGDIWMMNPDGTNLEQLTTNSSSDTSPQISPDGTKIVFVSDRTGSRQVWLMNSDGSDQHQLFDVYELPISYEYERGVSPTWAPDGSYLITRIELRGVVHSGPWGAIYRHDPDGSNPQIFLDWGPSMKGRFSISSYGNKFAYCREDSNYWSPTLKISVGDIVDGVVDGTSIYNLGSTIDGQVDEDVVWFSNGNKLMWSKSNGPTGYGIPYNLYSMNIDETNSTKLTYYTNQYATGPDFSPDEQKVVFTVSDGTTTSLYTMNPDGSDIQPLLVDDYKNSGPCWGIIFLPFSVMDIGVTSTISFASPDDIALYLPPEYAGKDISDAVVLNVNVTDNTPDNTNDDAYTDITINSGSMDIETCKVFKTGIGFLPEVDDVTTLPTVSGEPAFSRDLVNKKVTVRLYVGDPLIGVIPAAEPLVFDTGVGTYPNIMGTHNGTIIPLDNITVYKMYTYPCAGTGGHSKSIKLYENETLIASGSWDGYQSDYHNITIDNETGASYVMLLKEHKYNYTIVTGSYPQIIHAASKEVTGGTITCTSFVDANGKVYYDWIPAIELQ